MKARSAPTKRSIKNRSGEDRSGKDRSGPRMPAMGLESELELWLDDKKVRPEDVFASPAAFIGGKLVHRQGRSYHLPTGSAVYFDTGVIEVATPIVELERGAAARAARSLWEGIDRVRAELDRWQRKARRKARLVGFSTHTSVSFDVPESERRGRRTVQDLALLLVHILPAPVMLLACSRHSTGVGVRPRGDRIEITVDFTPDPQLMVCAATVIAGIARAVMRWPTFGMGMLAAHGLPVIAGFAPMPHTSRKGWLARNDCYPLDPFAAGPDAPLWKLVRERGASPATLRQIAARIFRHFEADIRAFAPASTFAHIKRVLAGRAGSFLDSPERPAAYDDVGRKCGWRDLFTERALPRAKYEQVLRNALAGRPLVLAGRRLTPVGVSGWLKIVFHDDAGKRVVRTLDDLVSELPRWR